MRNWRQLNLLLPTLEVLRRLQIPEHGHSADEWRGKCPFHISTSRRPRSFAVSIPLRKWYCHKCRTHGDLIDLWSAVRNITPLQAAKDLEELFL